MLDELKEDINQFIRRNIWSIVDDGKSNWRNSGSGLIIFTAYVAIITEGYF
jgi:predicted metal-dependent hydrolase